MDKKTIAALVAKTGIRIGNKIPVKQDTMKPKEKVRLGLNEASRCEIIKRKASGATVATLAKEFGVKIGEIERITNARNRMKIGDSDGATMLKNNLMTVAIASSELVIEKLDDLSAKDAAVVMGISTTNYLQMKAKTDGETAIVTPLEIMSLATTLQELRSLATPIKSLGK